MVLAPRMCRSTNRQAEPEVWFRVVHLAQDVHGGAPVASYREQAFEIALGPKGVLENGNVSALTRQVPADRVVSAVPRRLPLPAITESPVLPHVESFP